VEGFLVEKKKLVSCKEQGGDGQPPTSAVLSRGPFWAVAQFNEVVKQAAEGIPVPPTKVWSPLKNIWLYLDMSKYFKAADVQVRWIAKTEPRPDNGFAGTIARCVVYCSDRKVEMNL
jgi:hypothetical protein